MLKIKNKSECSGCHSCYNVCPQSCINMEQDEEGFKYPIIDETKCTECNLCEKVCPNINSINKISMPPLAFAAYNKDEKIRAESSSGGIFSIIAEQIIKRGGLVYGAAFDKNFNVQHQCISKTDSLEVLRGNKYSESNIGDTYKEIKKNLENNLSVLFSGTPCQVQGLKTYLNKEYDNLFCTDIICHGIPSPLVWSKYITQNKKSNYPLWKKSSFSIQYLDTFEYTTSTNYTITHNEDNFMKGFLTNLYLRPSCYKCNFKTTSRISDFTLATFWGIEHIAPELDDDKGLSLVMIHSSKAINLWENIKDKIFSKQFDLQQALIYNPSMTNSASPHINRSKFFKDINQQKSNINFHINYNIANSKIEKIKHYLKNLL